MPWSPLPDPDGPPPVKVGDTVDKVLRGLGAPAASSLGALFERWPEVVGTAIGSRTRPLSIDGTTLVVAVPDGGWASQLRWMERDLLATLATHLGPGVVTALELRVRPA